jgi:hypothetical protein
MILSICSYHACGCSYLSCRSTASIAFGRTVSPRREKDEITFARSIGADDS